jgi:hypothetical protein
MRFFMRLFWISLFILCIAANLQAQSYIEALSPAPYTVVGSSLSFEVAAYSPNGIKQVIAYIWGRSTPVIYNPANQFYYGSISLDGLPQDTLQLQLIATDSLNIEDTAYLPIIYDLPPSITVDSPVYWSVARPTLPMKAKCTDNSGHCSIAVTFQLRETNYTCGTFQDSVNSTIDLSPYDGNPGTIIYTAYDKYNQSVSKGSQVFVESSPYLEELYGGTDQIRDFDYNKVFITNSIFSNVNPNTSYIQDISTHDSVTVPLNSINNVSLTPYGAILDTLDSYGIVGDTYDWNNDSLYSLSGPGAYFKAAGNYAAGPWGDSFYLRDLSLKSSYPVPGNYSPTIGDDFDLTANGSAVFSAKDSNYSTNIFKYQSGVTQQITNNTSADTPVSNPLTDGFLTVYAKGYSNQQGNKIYLQKGDSSILLSDLSQLSSTIIIDRPYEVNNGFVAYTVVDSAGLGQIWFRDSTGNISQRSHFTENNNQLELLDSHGDLTFTQEDVTTYPSSLGFNRYFSSRSGVNQKVSSSLGTAYFRNNSFYIAIGRMLYKLNVNIPPNTVDTSAITTSKDSVYLFATTDFTSQFKGPGALMQVQITSLPAHGTIYLSGAPITPGQQIPRISLSSLTYTPDSSFAQDSIGWNGSNGYNYTNSKGLIILSDEKHFPSPIVSGLQSSYCSNQGNQKIKILNLPAANSGISAKATIDNINEPIAPDSSFQITLSGLSEGIHFIRVVYSNSLDSQQIKDSFSLIKAVTPSISLSAIPQTVSNTNTSIVITASNLSGGGTNPQFTFAKDNLFTNILLGPGAQNLLTISGSTLQAGNNWFYAKMQTSDSCYTRQFTIDSINIRRTEANGLIDPDFPDQLITIYPNPFLYQISVSGLQITKSYGISLMDIAGHQVAQQTVANSQAATIIKSGISAGVYLLKIYDDTKGRVIGTISLLKQ